MKLIVLLISLVLSQSLLANEVKLLRFKVFNSNNEASKISLYSYVNSSGINEVRIDAAGFPRLFNKLNPTIGYGRDLDGNGHIDTWFFITKNGIQIEQLEGKDKLGLDILGELIVSKYTSPLSLYLSTAVTTSLSYLFFTFNEVNEQDKNFYLDWINLEEMSLRLEQNKAKQLTGLSSKQIQFQQELITYGYKELNSSMETFKGRDLFGYIALDVGFWVSGGIILKWGGRLLATPLKWISENTFIKFISENIVTYFDAQKNILSNKLELLKDKFHLQNADEKIVKTGWRISSLSWRNEVQYSLRSMVIKKKLLEKSITIFKGAMSEWKYITLNIGVQTAAEGFTHYSDIRDPKPEKMAKNLLTNPDVQQNIGFMTMDTVLMTGMSHHLKSTKAKFMACGFIALHDSTMINFVIKRDDNYERIAMDTAWEVIVGNGQVQADLMALTFFEKLSLKNNNPKLKLLGYAFALVDQTVGYITYSKLSENLKESQKTILVPVFAEN
jgi:hypothetical protein